MSETKRTSFLRQFYPVAVGYCCILFGILVILMWSILLVAGETDGGQTEIMIHLVSEFLMAGISITAGILLLQRVRAGRHLAFMALGMLVYSELNTIGYYADIGQWNFVFLFSVLILISLFAISVLIYTIRK